MVGGLPLGLSLSSARTKRVMKEMRSLSRQCHPAFDIYPCVDDIFFWRMTMEGPAGTPYAGGVWLLYVQFPEEYPEAAPQIRFITPIRHCNINCYGRICHSILDRNYTIDASILTILQCVYGLLLTPDVSDPLDSTLALSFYDDSGLYETSIINHVKRHATTSRAQWKITLTQQNISKPDPVPENKNTEQSTEESDDSAISNTKKKKSKHKKRNNKEKDKNIKTDSETNNSSTDSKASNDKDKDKDKDKNKTGGKVCAKCGTQGVKLLICGSCKAVHYCSRDCQSAHWVRHRSSCVTKKKK